MSTPRNSNILDDIRRVIRLKHYSIHTERCYCDWAKQYIKFHKMISRDELAVESKKKIEDFLSYLAIQRNVAASTQNQAFNALLFLYKHVLEQPLDDKIEAVRSTKKRRIPVVLSQD